MNIQQRKVQRYTGYIVHRYRQRLTGSFLSGVWEEIQNQFGPASQQTGDPGKQIIMTDQIRNGQNTRLIRFL